MQKLCISLIFLSAIFIGSVVSQTFLVSTIYSTTACGGAIIAYSGNLAGSCTPLGTYWTSPICNSTGGFNQLFTDSACTAALGGASAAINCSSGISQACGTLPTGFLVTSTTYANTDCTGTVNAQSGVNPACTPTTPGGTSYRIYCPSYQSCTDSACMTCPVTPFAPVTIPPYAPVNPCVSGTLTSAATCPAVPTTPPTAAGSPGSKTPGVASSSDKLAPAVLLLAASLVVLA